MDVADRLSPVVGYRSWIFSKKYIVLGSPLQRESTQDYYQRGVWNPGVAFSAQCDSALKHASLPGDFCTCGIYALSTLEAARAYFNHRQTLEGVTLLVGSVTLWGRVVEHEQGFRSQYAYPKTLYLPADFDTSLAERLRVSYGVNLEVLPDVVLPPRNVKSSMHPNFARWLGLPVPPAVVTTPCMELPSHGDTPLEEPVDDETNERI